MSKRRMDLSEVSGVSGRSESSRPSDKEWPACSGAGGGVICSAGFVLAMFAGVACTSPQTDTAIALAVVYDDAWGISDLRITAGDETSTFAVSGEVRIVVPDEWAGTEVGLVVRGMKSDDEFAHGQVAVMPILDETVTAGVMLTRLPCGAWCSEGATMCVGDAVAICEQRDEDDCLEWSEPVACGNDAPYCSLGTCLAWCANECATGERRCDGPAAEQVCGEGDDDECLEWLPANGCAAGETCSNGSCRGVCQDECESGATQCAGSAVQTCSDLNQDGCTEWGPAVACASGSCSNGVCRVSCTDDCSASTCTGLVHRACGQFDLDSCMDISPGTSCVPDDACRQGVCSPSSGCSDTPRVCDEPPAPICLNGTTLRTYDAAGTCSSGDCDYPETDTPCSGGCSGGVCSADVGDTGEDDSLGVGSNHTCARKSDGTLWCWGHGSIGQLGNGSLSDQSSPVQVPGTTWSQVSAGQDHTCARKTDGTLWCWGRAIAVGSALDQKTPFQVQGTTWSQVSAGQNHTCARKTDGTLWCWGAGLYGRLGNGSTSNQTSPVQVPGTSWAQVSAGGGHTCARKTDGTLWCWGWGLHGELGQGSSADTSSPVQVSSTWLQVSAGWEHTCAIKTGGFLYCWGEGDWGRLGNGSSGNRSLPDQIPGNTWSNVSAGAQHTCASKRDGSLWCWGDGGLGQLGNGSTANQNRPVQVPGTSWEQVLAGSSHSCARKTGSALWCWGYGALGQLGIGSISNTSTPVQVPGSAWTMLRPSGPRTPRPDQPPPHREENRLARLSEPLGSGRRAATSARRAARSA